MLFGTLKSIDSLHVEDHSLVEVGSLVVIKQFDMADEIKGFKKELKILKKIKHLNLENNGGFPVVLSAKQSRSLGEILMTYVGKNIFDQFDLSKSFEDVNYHQALELRQLF